MKRLRLFCILLLLVAFGAMTASETLDKYQMMAYKVKPGVVKILSGVVVTIQYQQNEAPVQEQSGNGATGSGFIINSDGYVTTNGHVVELCYNYDQDKSKVLNQMIVNFALQKLQQAGEQLTSQNATALVQKWIQEHTPQIVQDQVVKKVYISNGDVYDYEIKKYSPSIAEGGKDIAVVKIEAHDLPVLKLGSSSDLKLQQLVFPVGYPGAASPGPLSLLGEKTSLEVSITRGTVSALKVDYKGVPVIQTDAAITHGNSGGPACNEDGEVIGISTFGSLASDSYTGAPKEVAGFNFLVPIDTAKEFIDDAGVKYNLSSKFNEKYDLALESVWDKKWYDAKEYIGSALIFLQNQPDLIKLRQIVEGKISDMGWLEKQWAKNKLAVILLVLIVFLVLLILVVMASSKGKKRSSTVAPLPTEPISAPQEPVAAAPERGVKESATIAESPLFGSLTVTVNGRELGTYQLEEKGLTIGRDPSQVQIVVQESIVSKVHALVLPEKERVVVVDRGSTNGTYLRGERIEKGVLQSGDSFTLGQHGHVVVTYLK
ncbi:MAG TPA: trypsin-like peptidase domain-containing protein [Candidatus Aminicenantes bacterium]|nr:trypsin-like peptidase domain-containing protein [Candidatus Aminicenantes bacterium]HPT00106.1 trypsin-like peptidase domain-containing protein [Candidatus Aminicenantes bacterium]